MRVLLPLGFATFLSLALVSIAAKAQSEAARSTAREIAKEGLAAYDGGRYAEALEKLSKAYEVVRVPTLALYSARAFAALGMPLEASERYLEAVRMTSAKDEAEAQRQARRDADQERQKLLPRLGRIHVELKANNAAQAEVEIDGQPVPPVLRSEGQLVNPGEHQIVARCGREHVDQRVTVREGQVVSVTLQPSSCDAPQLLSPAPVLRQAAATTPSKPRDTMPERYTTVGSVQRTAAWLSLGVGGLGLITGASTGLWALDKKRKLEADGCSGNSCYTDQAAQSASYNRLLPISTVGFVVGGLGTAAAITLWATLPRRENGTALAITFGPSSMGLRGEY